jgi:trans-2,3-dihydro-3-hydroxyanthranilate isomerase
MARLDYVHVDVFTDTAYGGNSLAVFHSAGGLSGKQMLGITQEMRHFESIFLEPTDIADTVRARVYDLFEELPFAGHPVIGAAVVLHHLSGGAEERTWRFELANKTVTITTMSTKRGYFGLLDQGPAELVGVVEGPQVLTEAFGLQPDDLDPGLPMEVVSTGLAYVIVPVRPGALAKASISADITELLRSVRAQFAVLLDEAALEIRHWNNDGIIEDVATGSAAGSIGAYRLRHGRARDGEPFLLHQGRFTGRPSTLRVQANGAPDKVHSVVVGGDVALVGWGTLEVQP